MIQQAKDAINKGESEREIKNLVKQIIVSEEKVQAFFNQLNKSEQIAKLERHRLDLIEPPKKEGFKSRNQIKQIQKKVISNSQVMCTTLAMSASEIMSCIKTGDYEYLIVDEAC